MYRQYKREVTPQQAHDSCFSATSASFEIVGPRVNTQSLRCVLRNLSNNVILIFAVGHFNYDFGNNWMDNLICRLETCLRL